MDNKAIAAALGFIAVAGLAALGVFKLISSGSSGDPSAIEADGFEFPDQQLALKIPARRAAAARATSRPPSSHRGSSLAFVRAGSGYRSSRGAAGAGISPDARAAAEQGDIEGVMKGLRAQGEDIPDISSAGSMSDRETRKLMQKVVDKVKASQPKWYAEFLAKKSLRRIADRYHKTNDFKRFLRDIGRSKSFEAMLKRKYRTKSMKRLTKKLLRGRETGPDLLRLFFKHGDDPAVVKLVPRYGRAAGLPTDMIMAAKKASGAIGKAKRRSRKRPKLKSIRYQGGSPPPMEPLSLPPPDTRQIIQEQLKNLPQRP